MQEPMAVCLMYNCKARPQMDSTTSVVEHQPIRMGFRTSPPPRPCLVAGVCTTVTPHIHSLVHVTNPLEFPLSFYIHDVEAPETTQVKFILLIIKHNLVCTRHQLDHPLLQLLH